MSVDHENIGHDDREHNHIVITVIASHSGSDRNIFCRRVTAAPTGPFSGSSAWLSIAISDSCVIPSAKQAWMRRVSTRGNIYF
jgi:hypothetical protein